MEASRVQSAAPRAPALWNTYFFSEERPVGMALMRLVLPFVLLIDVVLRHPWARELYSKDGAPAPLDVTFLMPGTIPELPGGLVVFLHALMIVSLLMTAAGWMTRISVTAAFVLYTYFGLLDSLSTLTKYTVIASHLLLLLAVSGCGRIWSVDAWLARRNASDDTPVPDPVAPVWPARLVQLFIGIVYLGAAITKMHTPTFFSGDQLMYWTMTYVNNVHPLGDWLSQYPLVLSLFGYITIVWEVAFVFAIFHPRMKWPALAIGAFFHFMTMFTLGLYIFPIVMYSGYLAYITADEWRVMSAWSVFRKGAELLDGAKAWLAQFIPAPQGKLQPWIPATAYAMLVVTASFAALGVEQWRDPFQERGPNGPLQLQAMSSEEVEKLFDTDRPLRAADKLLAFDLGTVKVGEHLANRKRAFRQGERIIAQATINPPHEDLWLDCWLHESFVNDRSEEIQPGRAIKKLGVAVGRELFRANFVFPTDESLPPGDYFLRLRVGKEDIAVKKFTILPGAGGAVSAN